MDRLTKTSQSGGDSNVLQYMHCDIGVYRVMEFHYFEGDNFVEFVTYEKSPSGRHLKVCNKSMKLSLNVMRVFLLHLESIDYNFERIKEGIETELDLHLGENYHLRMDKDIKCVDIRMHFVPLDRPKTSANLRQGHPGNQIL